MRRQLLVLSSLLALLLAFGAAQALAQNARPEPGTVPDLADIYCSGWVTPEAIPYDTYLISGEEAQPTTIYSENNYVYINKGASQGVKVGDEFLITRPEKDHVPFEWFQGQNGIRRAMGQQWRDLGRIKVVVAGKDVATALVTYACTHFERGDYVRPSSDRPAPTLKSPMSFDRFAPPSGKATGLVISSKEFSSSVGQHDIGYINLGNSQGVKVGDYVRFFRYQGTTKELVYQLSGMQNHIFGFGKAPKAYLPSELPREVLGEGVVLRTSPTSATVLVMHCLREIYMGDWVEIETEAPVEPHVNRPPTMSCAVERTPIRRGEQTRITATASDPDNRPLTYTWQASGGRIVGTDATADFDSRGVPEGNYTVTGHADNGRGGTADCSASVYVQAPPAPAPAAQPAPEPAAAPQASKTNECAFRASGSSRVDNVCKRILDDVALRLKSEPKATVVIVGFADPEEPRSAQLAQSRANAAQNYLVETRIDASRVSTRVGEAQQGAGQQSWRIDIVWVPAGATY
jgi:outer membrane protein OmpA-like peptidoglycan-associated protein